MSINKESRKMWREKIDKSAVASAARGLASDLPTKGTQAIMN
jgi:hypothetical protein